MNIYQFINEKSFCFARLVSDLGGGGEYARVKERELHTSIGSDTPRSPAE